MFARAGPEIEHVVRRGNGFGIVLDDEHRCCPASRRVLQDVDQAVRVAGMQADRRLVENVERADEVRPERRGELDALRFAAGKRGGQAVKREVVEADVVEEPQTLADLFQDFLGDLGLRLAKLKLR